MYDDSVCVPGNYSGMKNRLFPLSAKKINSMYAKEDVQRYGTRQYALPAMINTTVICDQLILSLTTFQASWESAAHRR